MYKQSNLRLDNTIHVFLSSLIEAINHGAVIFTREAVKH